MNIRERTGAVLLTGAIVLGACGPVNPEGNKVTESPSDEGPVVLTDGIIKVNRGTDLLQEDNGKISTLGYLPGKEHPDLLVSSPIIVLIKKDQTNDLGTFYRFFYRSYWRLVSKDNAETIQVSKNGINERAAQVKSPLEQDKPAIIILKNGQIIEIKVEELS